MKVELINAAGEWPRLLRFFAFSVSEWEELCDCFEMLSTSALGARVQLVPRKGFEAPELAGLDAVVADRDRGFQAGAPATWALSAEGWAAVRDRARALDPVDLGSFQWLDQCGSAWVLLSLSGQW